MQSEIIFRPLTARDYEGAVSLWRRSEEIELAEGDDEKSVRCYLDRNPNLSFCAEANEVIIGAALVGHDGRRGLIYHLAVAQEFRGNGIGKEILARGLAGLRKEGISRVLILVGEGNLPGRQFWFAQGFEGISRAVPLGLNLREA